MALILTLKKCNSLTYADLSDVWLEGTITKNKLLPPRKLKNLKTTEMKRVIWDYVIKRMESPTLNRFDLEEMTMGELNELSQDHNIWVNPSLTNKKIVLIKNIMKSSWWSDQKKWFFVQKEYIEYIKVQRTSIQKSLNKTPVTKPVIKSKLVKVFIED